MGSNGTSVKADALVIGVVKDLEDPQKLGRVRVDLPHLGNKRSAWARLATMMGGKDRGSLFRPEPEDEVLIGFLHGDPAQPFVIGGLWNEQDAPPENGGTKDNDLRTLRSRSGHVFRFNDKAGGEKIELIATKEKHRFIIDYAGKVIKLEADEGDLKITVKDNIEVQADSGDVKVTATTGNVSVKATAGNVEVEAGASVSVKANASIKLEATADITIQASGNVTIKGAQVMIN